MNTDYIIPPTTPLVLLLPRIFFWRVLLSNQFSSIYLVLTRVVAIQRFGAGVLGTQSNEDIKLDYVIAGS